MIKSMSILIVAALIAVTSQSAQAQQGSPSLSFTLEAGNFDEKVQLTALLLETKQPGTPCSLSFKIEAFDAAAIGAPLQTEHVMLGPDESVSLQFSFSLSLSSASGTHVLLLTVTDVKKTGGCTVLSHSRIVGPAGETRDWLDKEFLAIALSA